MTPSQALSPFDAALRAVEADDASDEEKAEMLMEIAMGMQVRPKSADLLRQAIALYQRADVLCPLDAPLLRARIGSRMGTALQALPDGGVAALHQARACYDESHPVLAAKGLPEEAAEVQLNLGLVLQALAGFGAARIVDAIACYHRALQVFGRKSHAQEFAILHNNLAIAYLSIPLADERARMREALAVQSFEEVLKVVNLIDHPTEYAMIQNNLGNALQYAASGHPLANNLRALAAYDEALKVRNPRDTPLEYANTLANKANVLRSLPDQPLVDLPGSQRTQAVALYEQALAIFRAAGQAGSAAMVEEALAEVNSELDQPLAGNGHAARKPPADWTEMLACKD
jgi:tetratricopeptide (TPR) repeat protein